MRRIAILFLLLINLPIYGQNADKEKIEWLSFSEAIERNKKEPRKIIIDIYTSWCGWCKKMDATTFQNPAIVKYLNEKYYAVKLNAEQKDSVLINNHWFINQNPEARRNPHDLAISLTEGKLSYPSTVFMDENINMIHPPIAGFLDAKTIEPILYFFGDNIYNKENASWEEFKESFQGQADKF